MAAYNTAGDGGERLKATEPYYSAHTLARVVMLLLAAYIIAALLSIASSYMQIELLERAADDHTGIESIIHGHEPITDAEAEANDLRETGVFLLRAALFIACAITFLIWLLRAHGNLIALGNPKESLDYSTGWVLGGWFIPLVNLIVPYRVVREVWSKSEPAVRSQDDLMFAQPGSAPLILGWWLIWVISSVSTNIYFRFSEDVKTPSDGIFLSKFAIAVNALNILAAVLAILVVRAIDRRQELRSRQIVFDAPMPPSPPTFN